MAKKVKNICDFCTEPCNNDHCVTRTPELSENAFFMPDIRLSIPPGVAGFKTKITDSNGQEWEIVAKKVI